MTDMLQTALTLAEQGWYVFALEPNSRRPLGGHGVHDATTDTATILDWWLATPDANIGIAPARSGHVVLDVDMKNGKNGLASLQSLAPELVLELDLGGGGRVVRTPTGGLHVYFKMADAIGNSVDALGEGLDVRGVGGYVVAPGSVIDGREYTLECDGEPGAAPAWLGRGREKREAAPDAELDTEAALDAARRYVENYPLAAEYAGSDHDTFKLFARLRDLGVSESTALHLTEGWADVCGFDPEWMATKARNAYAYAQNDAGCDNPAVAFADLIEAQLADEEARAKDKAPNRFKRAAIGGAAIDKMESPTWRFKKLIEDKSLNEIRGPYGAKKTFVALDLALSAAIGADWAGHECVAEQKVVYCAGEGAFGLRARVRAWAFAKNGSATPENFTLLPTVPMLGDPDDWAAFMEFAAEERPDMVFVDTLARAMVGLDEISGKDMGLVIHRCGELQALGIAVFLIHHEGKDGAKGSRGHTSLPGAVDLELAVASTDGVVKVATAKVKNAAEWEQPKLFSWAEVRFGDGEDDSSLVLTGVAGSDVRGKPKEAKAPEVDPFVFEVQMALEAAAQQSPNNRVRSPLTLARDIMRRRREAGVETRPPTSGDYLKAEEALRARLKRCHRQPAFASLYSEEDGGWRYS